MKNKKNTFEDEVFEPHKCFFGHECTPFWGALTEILLRNINGGMLVFSECQNRDNIMVFSGVYLS